MKCGPQVRKTGQSAGCDALSAGELRRVQRPIGGLDQGLDRRALLPVRGQPGAHRQAERRPGDFLLHEVTPDIDPDPLGGEPGVAPVRVGQHHGEFISAIPAGDIDRPEVAPDELAQGLEREVTGQVPVPVVRLLEAIEIEHQQRGLRSVAPAALQLAAQAGFQIAAAEQPREGGGPRVLGPGAGGQAQTQLRAIRRPGARTPVAQRTPVEPDAPLDGDVRVLPSPALPLATLSVPAPLFRQTPEVDRRVLPGLAVPDHRVTRARETRALPACPGGIKRTASRCGITGARLLMNNGLSCDLERWSDGSAPFRGGTSTGSAQKWCASATPHILLYLGPLPPSRGVQRGPTTSVALQSTQFGALTRSVPSTTSYTPAGHTW